MSTYDPQFVVPEDDDEALVAQPADPFEPEAPAHLDPDEETIVHASDADEEAAVDEAVPTPSSPAESDAL
jgi:hypothetical protein